MLHSFLKFEGWSHNAICAALGNMQQESNINPGRYQNGTGPGFGIVQWDPSTKYLGWASANGHKNNSISGQLNYLIYSMQPGKGEWFEREGYPGYYMSVSDFVTSTDSIEYLTQVFFHSYERAKTPHMKERISYAQYWNDYFS